MIERIYKCDLCRETRDRKDMVPIRWESVSLQLVVADENKFGPAERHLCKDCIEAIKRLP
jgi:hypothetical protein